jgi:hypothetical protein
LYFSEEIQLTKSTSELKFAVSKGIEIKNGKFFYYCFQMWKKLVRNSFLVFSDKILRITYIGNKNNFQGRKGFTISFLHTVQLIKFILENKNFKIFLPLNFS